MRKRLRNMVLFSNGISLFFVFSLTSVVIVYAILKKSAQEIPKKRLI